MTVLPPILVAPLFREMSERLLDLLRSLDADEWHQPTASSKRVVKDIVAHLLDGSLRRLSAQRDRYEAPDGSGRPRPEESLLDFLNRLNAEWETAARRLSPEVLIGLIEIADRELANLFESLDPFGPAIFPVAWAGEHESQNWMDVAREFTEKWHHTQQIFDAVRRPSTIVERRLFHPCLETFMRALPFTFREVAASEAAEVQVVITGDAGGQWTLCRRDGRWILESELRGTPTATVTISQDSAWKLFSKRLDRETALARCPDIRFDGDIELGKHVLDMVSVMA